MKKILFTTIMLLTLVACGKKYKTYSSEEKYDMIVKLHEIERKTDLTKEEENFKKEMKELLTILKTEAQKDSDAKKEFEDWRQAVIKFETDEINRISGESIKK